MLHRQPIQNSGEGTIVKMSESARKICLLLSSLLQMHMFTFFPCAYLNLGELEESFITKN